MSSKKVWIPLGLLLIVFAYNFINRPKKLIEDSPQDIGAEGIKESPVAALPDPAAQSLPMAINAPKPEGVSADELSFGKPSSSQAKEAFPGQNLALTKEEFETKKSDAKAKLEKAVEEHLKNHSLSQSIDLPASQLKCDNDDCVIKVVVDPKNQIAKTQLMTELGGIWSQAMKDSVGLAKGGNLLPKEDGVEIHIQFFESYEDKTSTEKQAADERKVEPRDR